MSQPFKNLCILDLTHVLAGPFCAYQFALLGADVIKIEPPSNPDCARGRGPDPAQNKALRGLNYQVQGANKRAIAVDLKTKAGQAIIKKMVAKADVFIENYRTGALDTLGLGFEDLRQINPSLIYCSLTGFGDEGPRAKVNAYDNVIQASSGIIEQSGGQKPGLSFIDYGAGYNAAFAIASALIRRHQTGEGLRISCSMFEVAMTMMAPEVAAAQYPIKAQRGKEAGISAYPTADGQLMLGAFTPDQNRRLWSLLDELGFETNPRWKSLVNWDDLWECAVDLKADLAKILSKKSAAAWQKLLHGAGLPAECQRTLADSVDDVQLAARGYFHQAEPGPGDSFAPQLPVAAYRFSQDGPEITSRPPSVGEHTREVLAEFGFSDAELDAFEANGVIRS